MTTRKKPFKKLSDMTKAEARVLIAKDVLGLLKRNRIFPRTGSYLVGLDCDLDDLAEDSTQIHDLLDKAGPCKVCALGAAFFSSVMVFDRIKSRGTNFEDRNTFTKHLGKFFSQKQLALIECAFEGADIARFLSKEEERFALAFHLHPKRDMAKSCLAAIMRNIVKNDGTFAPQPHKKTG